MFLWSVEVDVFYLRSMPASVWEFKFVGALEFPSARAAHIYFPPYEQRDPRKTLRVVHPSIWTSTLIDDAHGSSYLPIVNAAGSFPPEVGELLALTYLSLGKNQLSGERCSF